MKTLIVTFLFVLHGVATTLQIYDPPSIYPRSGSFSLTADGRNVPVTTFDGYAYAHFSFGSGPAKLKITSKKQSSISSFVTSPRKHGYDKSAVVSRNTLTFTMPNPHYVIVRLSGASELIITADPLETDRPASSGTGIFNVVSHYKADASGKSLSTAAFQKALDAAHSRGPGSVVYVPPGIYPIGNIILPSHTSLYLAPGSTLRFTGKAADYTKQWRKISQGLDGTEWIRTAHGSRNIKMYGRGTIDANGHYAQKTGKFICHAVVPLNTTEFIFDGPLIRDGGSWTLIPTRSSFVTIDHAKVLNRMNLGENDAIDVQESQHVIVKNSIGIALDDSFSTKTWKENNGITVSYPGHAQPISNVTFLDNLAWTHSYGFKVGQGVWQEQRKIHFQGGTVYDAAVGLGVHHKWGHAAVNEIEFTDMAIEHLHGNNDGRQTWLAILVQAGTPGIVGPINGVNLRNIDVQSRGTSSALTRGVSGARVSNVALRDIRFKDLGRAAKSLKEMGITKTEFSSNVVGKI